MKTGAPRPGSRKSPDYVVEIDTAAFSVEVKRPGSQAAIESKIAEAVHQTNEYASHPAVIALDLSDLWPVSTGVRDVAVTELQNKGVFRAATELARLQVVRRGSQAGYSRVGVLFCFAESFLWEAPAPHPVPKAAVMMYAEVFPDAYEGLIVDQARKLRQSLVSGFEETGGRVRLFRRL